MRRSALAFTVTVAATIALVPASLAIGPGGWDHVGTGSTTSTASLNAKVSALNTDASGVLYVGGPFTNAGGHANADRIAKWNGSSWSAIGATPLSNGEVRAIAYSAGKVYVGGTFVDAGGHADADYLAVWDGVSWAPFCNSLTPPAFTHNVDALQIIGNTLYVGGEFQDGAGISTADYLVACDLSSGESNSLFPTDGQFSGPIYALAADSLGTLYAGGNFNNLAQLPGADNVAAYASGAWHAMGADAPPVTGIVRSLTASGTNVYVGTDAVDVTGIAQADHVARWTGSAWNGTAWTSSAWSALGANSAGTNGWFPASASVYALRVNGSLVFAAGTFQNANGVAAADHIAYFDGTTWRTIGSNGAGDGPLPAETHALRVFEGKIYAGGNFTTAGGDTRAKFLAAYALRLPDNSISRVSSSGYVGNSVYTTTGSGQARTVSILKGRSGNAYVKIQNDGLVATSFKVKGTGGASGIRATYFRSSSGANITSAVKAGTYSSRIIAPKSTILLRVRIDVAKLSAAGTTFVVTTRSVTGTQPDAVRAVISTHR